jgi:membrane protein DedA with SNARE-associated domain
VDLTKLVETYGYYAVFGGALLEGETVLALAGFAASNGYLNIGLVIAVAIVGAVIGDQIFFAIGRLAKGKVFANRGLVRYGGWLVVLVRFMYGFRIAGPIAIGISDMHWGRFFFFNTLGAIIWAPLIAGAGFFFGHALLQVLERMRGYEIWVFSAFAAILVLGFIFHKVRQARATRRRHKK